MPLQRWEPLIKIPISLDTKYLWIKHGKSQEETILPGPSSSRTISSRDTQREWLYPTLNLQWSITRQLLTRLILLQRQNFIKSTASLSSLCKEKDRSSMEQKTTTSRQRLSWDLTTHMQTSTIIQKHQTIKGMRLVILIERKISWTLTGSNSRDKSLRWISEKEFISSLQMCLGWIQILNRRPITEIEKSILLRQDNSNFLQKFFLSQITRHLPLHKNRRERKKTLTENSIIPTLICMDRSIIKTDLLRRTLNLVHRHNGTLSKHRIRDGNLVLIQTNESKRF